MFALSRPGARPLLGTLGRTLLTCSLVGSLAIPNPALAASAASAPDASASAVAGAAGDATASVAAADAIEFVYVESSFVATGATENVAVGLMEGVVPEGALVSSARLTLVETTSGAIATVDATKIAGRSLLFACAPAAGTYEVRGVEASLGEGGVVSADLSATDAATRTFEVSDRVVAVAADDAAVDVRDPSQYAPTTETGREALAASGDAAGAGVAAGAGEAAEKSAATLSVMGAADEGTDELATAVTTVDSDDTEAVAAGVEALLVQSGQTTGDLSEQFDVNGDGIFAIAIDPGHGGDDSGAVGVEGARECDLNWSIANYCKEELQKYGVPVSLTRDWGDNPSLQQRVANAADAGADVLVSIHLNATTGGDSGAAAGCMVLVPSDQGFNNRVFGEGVALGNAINDQLAALGINNRGLLFRTIDHDPDWDYPTGEEADYYGIVRHARYRNMLGVIVEHCYIDNTDDYYSFLNSEDKLRALGVADATGIARAYGLSQERQYAAVYNFEQYMALNSDLPQYYANDRAGALAHFLEHGMAEGRRASDDFDVRFYKDNYSDLRTAFGDDYVRYFRHYMTYGVSENRQPTADITAEKNGMRRLYNPYSGEHFYTAAASEKVALVKVGWNYEGLGWFAPASSSTPVFRLYNSVTGDHHYTLAAEERDALKGLGWNDEGTGWHSDDAKGAPLYRQYNPYAWSGTHNYTTSKSENDQLVALGWREEGIGWYGLAG